MADLTMSAWIIAGTAAVILYFKRRSDLGDAAKVRELEKRVRWLEASVDNLLQTHTSTKTEVADMKAGLWQYDEFLRWARERVKAPQQP